MSIEEDESLMIFSGTSTITEIITDKEIRTSGDSHIEGNIECSGFRTSGSLRGTGNIRSHKYFLSAGSFNLTGNIFCSANAGVRGSGKLEGGFEVGKDFNKSGSLLILGDLIVGQNAYFRGNTKIENKVEAIGSVQISGTTNFGSLQTHDDITSSGMLTVDNDVKSEKSIDVVDKLVIGGNIYSENITFDYRKGARKSWYWTVILLSFLEWVKYPYRVAGSVHAKELVKIDRATVGGDIKAKHVELGRYTKVVGNVYYVDECKVHRRAKLTHPPIKIKLEEL